MGAQHGHGLRAHRRASRSGVIANQPWYLGGVIDSEAAQKAAKFVRTCNSFGVPLVVLVDTPGFLPGTKQEGLGVIRHGAKLLHAFSEAVVPKVTVVLRKAYGGAYICMNSKDLGADLLAGLARCRDRDHGAQAGGGRRAHAAPSPSRTTSRPSATGSPTKYADEHVSARVAAEHRLHRRAGRAAGHAPAPGRSPRGALRPRAAPATVAATSLYDDRRKTYAALGDSFTAGVNDDAPRWADEVARALGPGHPLREPGLGRRDLEGRRARAGRPGARAAAGPGHARVRCQRRAAVHAPRSRPSTRSGCRACSTACAARRPRRRS